MLVSFLFWEREPEVRRVKTASTPAATAKLPSNARERTEPANAKNTGNSETDLLLNPAATARHSP